MSPRELGAWAGRCESALRRHPVLALTLAVLLVAGEGVRLIWRGKLGDFAYVHAGLARLVNGETLYVLQAERSYPYSPAFAMVFAPLGLLPVAAAKAFWYALGVFSLVASCRLAARLFWPDRPAPPGFTLLTLAAAGYFAHSGLQHGQATPLWMTLALLSYSLDLRGRPALGGLCLAAATMIKPFPALFLLFFLIRKRWRVSAAFAIGTLALLAAPALLFGSGYPDVLRGWSDVVKQQQTLYSLTGYLNQSSTAFWNRLLAVEHPDWWPLRPTLANAGVVATGLTMLGLSCRTARRPSGHDAFALFMICCAALPPLGWKHYYVTLLFPAALLAQRTLEGEGSRSAERTLIFLVASVLLLHVRPPFAPDLMHEASLVFWMGAAAFAAIARPR